MEKVVAQFFLNDGTPFLVEIDEPESGVVERVALDTGQIVIEAKQSFEEALEKIKPLASTVISKFRGLKTPADEVEVKFGLKLSADAGIIISSIGGEVNFEVTLKWTQN